jgi:hypothetical protein
MTQKAQFSGPVRRVAQKTAGKRLKLVDELENVVAIYAIP